MPLSLPTIKVHLRQQHQNIRSTNTISTKDKMEAGESPTQESNIQGYFFCSQKSKPERHNQNPLEDIQLFRVLATSTFTLSIIMKLIAYRQHIQRPLILQKSGTPKCIC